MLRARRAAPACWIALLAACSAPGPTTPPQSQPHVVAAPAARARIELGELTVRFDGMPIARLYRDGRTESVGDRKPGPEATFSPGPTLHADGTIELTNTGFGARVEPDGDIVVISPPGEGPAEHVFGHLTADQLLLAGAGDSGVRLEGAKLVMFHDSRPTNMLGVIDPPTMGRTALIVTAAFLVEMALRAR